MTIVSPMDYEGLSVLLAFSACETRQCVNVNIVDDFEIEQNVNIFYTLERAPGLNPNIQLISTQGEILIGDNDGKIFQKSRLSIQMLLLILISNIQGFAQCHTSSNCTGDIVPADDARDCCVGTDDGQSYGVAPGICEVNQCIGESAYIIIDTL